jgi:hypothetical protein
VYSGKYFDEILKTRQPDGFYATFYPNETSRQAASGICVAL